MRPTSLLLDLGGVLTVDPWQAVLLTPGRGLADRLGLDREGVEKAAADLWPSYAREPATEDDYWRELSIAIGSALPLEVVRDAESELLRPLSGAVDAIEQLIARDVSWGLITNNTSFWYEKQIKLLGLSGRLIRWEFTSFSAGVEKCDRPGLFDIAASILDDGEVLVVDDRETNIHCAHQVGFRATLFPDGSQVVLSDLLYREGLFA